MKKSLIYNKQDIGKSIIDLNKCLWDYEYYKSQSVNPSRYNNIESSRYLISFDYKGFRFNMITCPAGGKVSINKWGLQEIKEPFMLGETEITQELFELVMGFNYSRFKSSKNPVENVNWFDCLEFCNRLSDFFGLTPCYILRNKEFWDIYPPSIKKAETIFIVGSNGFRLPREWEWEIAAKAGTNNKYVGANDDELLKRVAWFSDNTKDGTRPIAQKLPNEWGFYDMSGNVSEWCENATSPTENNDPSAKRIYRGGSWGFSSAYQKPGSRSVESSSDRNEAIGFRIARTI